MSADLAAPLLEQTLRRLLARERRGRFVAAIWRTCATTALAAMFVAGWRIYDRVFGLEPLPILAGIALVLLTAFVGLAFVVRAATGRSEREMAREIDRRLGLQDRSASAMTLIRGDATSRLAAFVIGDAEAAIAQAAPRVDAAFPSAPSRSVRTLKWLARAAFVVALLAVLAELLDIWGPLPWLPGFANRGGGDTSAVAPTAKDAPRREVDKAEKKSDEPSKRESKKPDEKPKPPTPEGDVRVTIRPAKDEFDHDEAIYVTVTTTATGEIKGSRVFDIRVSVDGVEVDTGLETTLDPGKPEGARERIDLRRVPGLKIAPGEHVARARLMTRTTHEEFESAPAKFRVRSKPEDDQPKDDAPKNKPKPKPQPEPQPEPSGEQPKKDDPSTGAPPPPPPAALDKKVVVPLFGEGEEVKKKGVLLVLDPGGGIETPPKERPLGEALPEARKRAEAEVDRAGVRAEDRDLVRRYFELLEKLGK